MPRTIPYPNWVFIRCLERLEAEAAQMPNSRIVFTYRKALRALERYPVVLPDARAALVVDGIGPGIVDRLALALREHEDADGSRDDLPVAHLRRGNTPRAAVAPAGSDDEVDLAILNHVPAAPKGKPPLAPPAAPPPAVAAPELKKRARTEKQYLPRYQSGGYALLVALLESEQDPTLAGYLGKTDLMNRAQKHCPASFSKPAQGSQYTAWAGMAKLVEVGYVKRAGSPARFQLTTAGREVAKTVLDSAKKVHTLGRLPSSDSDDTDVDGNTPAPLPSDDDDDATDHGEGTQPVAPLPFAYHFVAPGGHPCKSRDAAEADVRGDRLCLKVQFNAQQRSHPTASLLELEPDQGVGLLLTAWMPDELALDRVELLVTSSVAPAAAPARPAATRTAPPTAPPAAVPLSRKRSALSTDDDTPNGSIVERALSLDQYAPAAMLSVAALDPAARPCGLVSVPPPAYAEIDEATVEGWAQRVQTTTLDAGSYDVVLLVDNRERRDRKDGTFIQEQLARRGLKVETRPLAVGDMLWLARERHAAVSPREVVLGYVVERKRLDDLVSSMRDGRFREQRFRLSTCNADHVIYVIEELAGPATDLNKDMPACATAMWHLQVFDQFFVKQTTNFEDTIQYLADMTQQITDLYRGESVRAISWVPDELGAKEVRAVRALLARTRGQRQHVTADLYAALNAKSKPTTAASLFVQQLLRVQKVGEESATAVATKYPTMHSLLRAYHALPTEPQKQMLLAEISYGRIKRRKLGPAASQAIYNVFGALHPATDAAAKPGAASSSAAGSDGDA